MSIWKERLQRVKNDFEENLKSPKTKQELQKIKDGAKQIVDGARHVSTQIVQKPDDTTVAVVVEEPVAEKTQKTSTSDKEARLVTKGVWDKGIFERVEQEGIEKEAAAITEVALFHDQKLIVTWTPKKPVLLTAGNVKVIEDLVGNFAWSYEDWQDRSSTTGWLVTQCNISALLRETDWNIGNHQTEDWLQIAPQKEYKQS